MIQEEIDALPIHDRIAYNIRAELVCCMIYHNEEVVVLSEVCDETDDVPLKFKYAKEIEQRVNGHEICYWGEAAALIAEEGVNSVNSVNL